MATFRKCIALPTTFSLPEFLEDPKKEENIKKKGLGEARLIMDFSPSSVALSPSTQSPIFRPRRSDDWDKYRDIIEDLYFRRGDKLKNVVKLMEEQHNFHASYCSLFLFLLCLFLFLFFLALVSVEIHHCKP